MVDDEFTGWRETYRALGVDPDLEGPGTEDADPVDVREYVFEYVEKNDLRTAAAYCDYLDDVLADDDELWILQVQGKKVVPIAYGTTEGRPAVHVDYMAETGDLLEGRHPFDLLEQESGLGDDVISRYFSGLGTEIPEELPDGIEELGSFHPEGQLQGAYLAPGFSGFYR